MNENIRRCRFWLAGYGISVITWWCVLFFSPASQGRFFLGKMAEGVFWMFLLADLVLLGIGPLLACVVMGARPHQALRILWLIFGATFYATLCCVMLLAMHEGTILALGSMTMATILMLFLIRKLNSAIDDATIETGGGQ